MLLGLEVATLKAFSDVIGVKASRSDCDERVGMDWPREERMHGLEESISCLISALLLLLGHQAASICFIPLITWTSYATALNIALLRMNPTGGSKVMGRSDLEMQQVAHCYTSPAANCRPKPQMQRSRC